MTTEMYNEGVVMAREEKVTTLVIHTPGWAVKEGAKSFQWVLEHNMGYGYAIYKGYVSKIQEDCRRVVLLKKDKPQRRAEGEFVKLEATGIFTDNGIQRFDVYTKNLTEVDYKDEDLNRCGIALIDC